MLDLYNNLTKVVLAAPASVNADANRTGVDVSPYIGVGIVQLICLNTAGSTPTFDVKLQHSSDDGSSDTYADIPAAAFTQVTNAAAGTEVIALNLDSVKKYVRVVDDIGGTSSPAFTRSVTLFARKQVTP